MNVIALSIFILISFLVAILGSLIISFIRRTKNTKRVFNVIESGVSTSGSSIGKYRVRFYLIFSVILLIAPFIIFLIPLFDDYIKTHDFNVLIEISVILLLLFFLNIFIFVSKSLKWNI